MNELHLFAGAGGGILGSELLGMRTVCAVELEPYPSSVLLARQNDGLLSPFPVWDDVRTFDGRRWRGLVDVVSGGFPCQDISAAGKGAGIDGARSGLWREMHRIVGEVRPRFVFVENSPMLTSRGLGCVLGDLAAIGYDAEWMVLGADDVGAPHERKRMWILAKASDFSQGGWRRGRRSELETCQKIGTQGAAYLEDCGQDVAHVDLPGCQKQRRCQSDGEKQPSSKRSGWWTTEPDVVRMVHGVAGRVDRIKALGNGQVPAVAATAFRVLLGRFQEGKEGNESDS